MPKFTKIAITKKTVLQMLKENIEESGDDPTEVDNMDNEELGDYFVGAGYLSHENEFGGVYDKEIPPYCIAAEVVGNITGFPCGLEEYYEIVPETKLSPK